MRDFEIENLVYKIGLSQLEQKDGKFHFRCPICGDSAHSQRKKRGWIFEQNSEYRFHCFNCSYSAPLPIYFKQYRPELYNEYLKILFFRKEVVQQPILTHVNESPLVEYEKLDLPTILSLNDDEKAKKYIKDRKIPFKFWNNLYYADKYKQFVNTLLPNKFENTTYDDERIVIPIYNIHKKIVGVQGRSLIKKAKIRYITILFNENDLNVCGLERLDRTKRIYITEGYFDSLFLPNAISMNSSNIPLDRLSEISNKDNFVFVFDNEKRNKQIINRMIKIVRNGYKILLWPDGINGKDINEMIKFQPIHNIIKIIESNVYSGMLAEMKIRTRFI